MNATVLERHAADPEWSPWARVYADPPAGLTEHDVMADVDWATAFE